MELGAKSDRLVHVHSRRTNCSRFFRIKRMGFTFEISAGKVSQVNIELTRPDMTSIYLIDAVIAYIYTFVYKINSSSSILSVVYVKLLSILYLI